MLAMSEGRTAVVEYLVAKGSCRSVWLIFLFPHSLSYLITFQHRCRGIVVLTRGLLYSLLLYDHLPQINEKF